MHAKTDSIDMNKKNNIPGPGTYNLQNQPNTKMTSAPAYRMGTGMRGDIGGGKESKAKPGPGNYDGSADLKKTAPKFGFGTS